MSDEMMGRGWDLEPWATDRLPEPSTPERRDTFARLSSGMAELPGFTPEDERYFRDVYDHLIRISDLIDSYRDLLTGAMDVYLSTVSNRLNAVMKQLAVIATIFLPLSWLTGFFGQNFGWLVGEIGHWEAFVGDGEIEDGFVGGDSGDGGDWEEMGERVGEDEMAGAKGFQGAPTDLTP